MNRCLDATSDKKLFKKETSTRQRTKLDEQRPADIRVPRTHQKLNNSIRDCMVRYIGTVEQGEEEDKQSEGEEEQREEDQDNKDSKKMKKKKME